MSFVLIKPLFVTEQRFFVALMPPFVLSLLLQDYVDAKLHS